MVTKDSHPRKITIDVGYSNKLNTESSVQAISEIDEQNEETLIKEDNDETVEEQSKSNESDHANIG